MHSLGLMQDGPALVIHSYSDHFFILYDLDLIPEVNQHI